MDGNSVVLQTSSRDHRDNWHDSLPILVAAKRNGDVIVPILCLWPIITSAFCENV